MDANPLVYPKFPDPQSAQVLINALTIDPS